jgi:hypothetical protein
LWFGLQIKRLLCGQNYILCHGCASMPLGQDSQARRRKHEQCAVSMAASNQTQNFSYVAASWSGAALHALGAHIVDVDSMNMSALHVLCQLLYLRISKMRSSYLHLLPVAVQQHWSHRFQDNICNISFTHTPLRLSSNFNLCCAHISAALFMPPACRFPCQNSASVVSCCWH